jgi:transcriptional regulator with XRE-family HTH domain
MKSNLKQFRQEDGLTLQQLADKSGVCKSQIYELQKDGANPTLETAIKISEALEMTELGVFVIWPQ